MKQSSVIRIASSSIVPWGFWGLTVAFYLYGYSLRIFSRADALFAAQFLPAHPQVESWITCYYYAYAPIQLCIGWLVDKIGIRTWIFALSVGLCLLGHYLCQTSTTSSYILLGRFLKGAGAGNFFILFLYFSYHAFGAKSFPRLFSLGNAITMFGISLIEIVSSSWEKTLFSHYLYHGAVLVGMVLLLGPCSLFYKRFFHNPAPRSVEAVPIQPAVWANALAAALFYTVTSLFWGYWGPEFILIAYPIPENHRCYITAAFFIGWAWGSLSGAKNMSSISRVSIRSLFASMIIFLCLLYLPVRAPVVAYLLILLLGFFSSAQLLHYIFATRYFTFLRVGTAAAITNTIVCTGVIMTNLFIEKGLSFFARSSSIDGLPICSLETYQIVFAIFPILLLVSAFISRLCLFHEELEYTR